MRNMNPVVNRVKCLCSFKRNRNETHTCLIKIGCIILKLSYHFRWKRRKSLCRQAGEIGNELYLKRKKLACILIRMNTPRAMNFLFLDAYFIYVYRKSLIYSSELTFLWINNLNYRSTVMKQNLDVRQILCIGNLSFINWHVTNLS